MTFDLAVWDAVRPPRVAEAERRYAELRDGEDPTEAPSPRIAAFAEECERRWPSRDGDGSPLFTARRTPSALLLHIRADVATELFGEWAALSERHGLMLYDPQSGIVRIPSRLSFDAQPPASTRGWFGCRRG